MTHSGPPGVTDNDFVDDELEDHVEPEAEGLALSLFVSFAALMIVVTPFATRPAPQDKGWFQEPMVWPLLVLVLAVGAGIKPLRQFLALRSADGFGRRVLTAFNGSSRTNLQAALFCVYLWAISYLGFSVASLLYLQILFWLSGLRGGKWPFIAFAVGIAIITVFRVGLGIWFPLPPVMSIFPDWVGNTFGGYL